MYSRGVTWQIEGSGRCDGRHIKNPLPHFNRDTGDTALVHAFQDEVYHFITSHAGATHGYAVRVWPFVPAPRPAASAAAAAAATTAATNQRAAAGGGGVSCWYSLASLEHEVRLWYNLGRNQCFR